LLRRWRAHKGPDTVGEPRDKFSLYYYKVINILD
jgi:hypothetical protein